MNEHHRVETFVQSVSSQNASDWGKPLAPLEHLTLTPLT